MGAADRAIQVEKNGAEDSEIAERMKTSHISGAKSGKISTNLKPEARYDGYDLAASCQLDSCHVACLVEIQLRRGVQCSPSVLIRDT